ncbi:Glycoprotein 3-alpha-L-fucosyltransferase A [Mizuhopecten yessoensis]|uniref:Fucosyltransferase n=2 Tax=Mizuhopecten yessoensis TaxID=6573 RepID=A0A210R327_MIZYE|nr:Glycoprotein 3-alpha-L-fucosyltransferase A [Mizuhopecten yessoensis]OWF55480.1 Glycoprotein 3-alpha-L-fucosyltransferase A [Mizuhopecten yessoensis]
MTYIVYNVRLSMTSHFAAGITHVRTGHENETQHRNGCNTCRNTGAMVRAPNKQAKKKLILFYNPLHWWNDWMEGRTDSSAVFQNCSVQDCTLTKDVTKLAASDAVFFNMHTLPNVPEKRLGQVWIFSEFEAPENFADKDVLNKFMGKINWTFTYRRDSDFHIPHGRFVKRSQVLDDDFMLQLKSKVRSKVAVGFISHCGTPSRRMEYVEQIKRSGIHVDIYGKCGERKCYGKNRHKTSWNITQNHKNKCFSATVPTYKFYLSLENALCRDYVTEKSLNLVLRYNIVPVVRDGANRSLYHPPGSTIDTKKFRSAVHLGIYLSGLNSNMAAYQKFFRWRKYFYTEGILNSWNKGICDLCQRLHNENKYRRIYGDIAAWYIKPGQQPACYKPKDLYNKFK